MNQQLILYSIYTVVALFVAFMVIDYVAHRIRLRRLRREAYPEEARKGHTTQ